MSATGSDLESVWITERDVWIDGPPHELFKRMRSECPQGGGQGNQQPGDTQRSACVHQFTRAAGRQLIRRAVPAGA